MRSRFGTIALTRPECLGGEPLTREIFGRGEQYLVVLRPILHLIFILGTVCVSLLAADLVRLLATTAPRFVIGFLGGNGAITPRLPECRLLDGPEWLVMPIFEAEQGGLDTALRRSVERRRLGATVSPRSAYPARHLTMEQHQAQENVEAEVGIVLEQGELVQIADSLGPIAAGEHLLFVPGEKLHRPFGKAGCELKPCQRAKDAVVILERRDRAVAGLQLRAVRKVWSTVAEQLAGR
ncbi:hypothetical protein [Sphingomonas sp.]|uniref:hypothetical protein n=1 Tax=Sphingomonas sp. TaxID=28214 RepID=UPI003D6D0F79